MLHLCFGVGSCWVSGSEGVGWAGEETLSGNSESGAVGLSEGEERDCGGREGW